MQITLPRSHELEIWQKGSSQNILAEHHAGYFGETAYQKLNRELVEQVFPRDPLDNPWADSDLAMDVMSHSFERVLQSWRTYGINGYLFHVEFKVSALYQGKELNRFGKTMKATNSPFLFYIGGSEENFVAKDHHFVCGEAIHKSAILVNDTFHDVAGEMIWEAKTEQGKRLAGATLPVKISQGERHFVPLQFDAPEVEKKTRIEVTAKLSGQDGETGEDKFELTIFPASQPPKLDRPIALIDATGETEAVLKEAGLEYVLVNLGTDSDSLAKSPLLVIGKGSYPAAVAIFGEKLPAEKAIREGMNVLCLSQRNRSVMGLKLENFNARQAFIRTDDAEIFQGFDDRDFSHWRGESKHLPSYPKWSETTDWRLGQASKHGQRNAFGQGRYWHWSNKGTTATFCFEKPQMGNFRVLMDAGFDLLYTPLIEFRQGRGRIVLSQLDLVDHYDEDPVAARFLHRLIGEYSRPGKSISEGKLAYLGGGKKEKLLDELKIDFAKVAAPPEDGGALFLEPENFAPGSAPQLAAQLDEFVKNGGTVLVTRSRTAKKKKSDLLTSTKPAEKEKPKLAAPSFDIGFGKKPESTSADDILADVSEKKSTKTGPKADDSWSWMLPVKLPLVPREIFQTTPPTSPVFSGIGMSEFYWQGVLDFEAVDLKNQTAVAESGLIGQVNHGKGRIVFVQFEPNDFEASWQRGKVLRIYNTLLTNLGVKSKVPLEIDAIGGAGKAEEWLPGYAPKAPDEVEKLSVFDAHYARPALDFDPYKHRVW